MTSCSVEVINRMTRSESVFLFFFFFLGGGGEIVYRKVCSIHGIAMVWSCKTSGWGKHSRNGHGKSPLLLSTQDLCYFLYLLLQVHQKPAKRLNRHQIEVKLLKLLNFLHSASFSYLSFFRFSATRFNFCLLYTLGSTFYGNHVNPY